MKYFKKNMLKILNFIIKFFKKLNLIINIIFKNNL